MNKFKFVLGCLSLSIFLVLTSCKIGLGQAVDTESPEISIDYPAVGVIIRDSFAIGGKWSDDGDIEQDGLKITVKRTDGTGTPVTYLASKMDKGDGTWNCIVEPLDKTNYLLDGEYQAVVSITDTYKHVTEKSTTFTIDNTPPIVVLQRPSAKGSNAQDSDSYGQTFTLEGQAADDNNVDTIEVQIYSDSACKNHLLTIPLSNVPPTISLDVAKFEENKENEYSKIYGSTSKNGVKQFYCKIQAYDGAQRYPADGSNQCAADTKGNSTDFYYLYDEIATSILSKYKITEVYQMNNGNYKGDTPNNRSATVDFVKNTLAASKVSIGSFSLNPANNPMFSVSGKEQLKKDGSDFADGNTDYHISNGNSVVVEVSPGLDGIPLDDASLKVYFIECDGNCTVTQDAKKIYPSTGKSKSGSSYKFTTALTASNDGLVLGHNYLFGVEGYDQNNTEVVALGTGYGFHFASSGAAPVLEITEPASKNFYLTKTAFENNGKKQVIKGKVSVETGIPVINLKNNTTGILTVPETDIIADTSYSDGKMHYTFSVDIGEYSTSKPYFIKSDETAQYTYTIEALQDGVPAAKDVLISFDAAAPTFDVDELTPIATNYYDANNKLIETGPTDTTKYINGTEVLMSYSVEDDDKVDETSIKYFVYEGNYSTFESIPAGTSPKISVPDLPKKGTAKINTKLLSEGPVTIVLEAKDRAGNTGHKVINDYVVKQSTDNPVILPNNNKNMCELKFADYSDQATLENYLDGLASLDNLKDVNNLFFTERSMYFTAYDDDGVSKVSFDNYLPGATEKDNNTSSSVTLTDSESETVEYNLPGAGVYKLVITVTDNNGKTSKAVTFWYKVIGSAPTFSKVEGIAGKYVSTNTNATVKAIDVSFEIDETTPPYTITYIQTQEGKDKPAVTLIENTTERTITKSFSPASDSKSGESIVRFILKDKYRETEKNYSYKFVVDNDAPTLDKTKFKLPSVQETVQSSFKIKGNAQDNTSGSGIEKVQFAFSASPADNEIYEASGTEEWTANVVFADYAYFATEGVKNIWIRAIDNVGNASEWVQSENFVYDKADPVFSLNKLNGNPVTGTNFQTSDVFSLAGTAFDGYALHSTDAIVITQKSGTDSVELKIKAADITSGEWTLSDLPRDFNNSSKTLKEGTKAKSGLYEYTFKVTDAVGKEVTSPSSYKVTIDNDGPTLTLKNPSELIDISGESSISGTEYTFKAFATDNGGTGVNKIYYLFSTEDKSDVSTYTGFENVEASDDISVSIPKDIVSGHTQSNGELYEGQWYFVLYATDEAGNKSDFIKKPFYVDKAAPTVTETYVTEPNGEKTTNATAIKLQGAFEESNGIKTFVVNDNGTEIKVFTAAEITSFINNSKWELEFNSANSNVLTDGVHNISIVVTDLAGRITTIDRKITVDTKTPEVATIVVPQNGSKDTESSLYKFTGTVTDAAPSSGYDAVEFTFTDDNTAPAAGANVFTTSASSAGEWSYPVEFQSNDFKSFFTDQGDKYLWVRVKDNAGNVSAWSSKKFIYDTESPSITETTVKTDGTYKNAKFTLGGTVKDTYEVEKVTVSAVNTNTSGTTSYDLGEVTISEETWSKEIEPGTTTGKIADGEYTFTIEVEDKAGKKSTAVRKVIVDTKAPAVLFAEDKFTNYVTISENKWYKTSTISIGGTYNDGIEGITTVSDIKKVECNINNGGWSDLICDDGSWSGTINLTAEGSNSIEIRATDKAGNVSDSSSCKSTVYYDSKAPSVCSVTKIDDTTVSGSSIEKLTNGSSQIKVILSVADDTSAGENKYSGVSTTASENADVTITQIGQKAGLTLKSKKTDSGYEITIPKYGNGTNQLEYTSGMVKATVKDKAGNAATFDLFQIQFDNEYPKVQINDISDADTSKTATGIQVNGTITITGSASDNKAIKALKAKYKKTADSTWTEYTDSTITGTTNWSFDVNTKNLSDKTSYDFMVYAEDTAGNIGNSGNETTAFTESYNKTVIVNQDTDRPTITFSNIAIPTGTSTKYSLKNVGTIYGSVMDDDGVDSFSYSKDSGNTWIPVTLNGNSFEIYFDDGPYTLSFRVVDKGKIGTTEKTTFESSTSNLPKIIAGTTPITSADMVMEMIVDKTAPTVQNYQFAVGETETGNYTDYTNDYSKLIFGGKKDQIKVSLEAKDENEISAVSVKVGNNTPVSGAYKKDSAADDDFKIWEVVDIPLAGVTGAVAVEITVTDGAGLTKTDKYTLNVDNSAPVVEFSAPSELTVNSGDVTVYGTVNELCVVNGISQMYYAISTDGTNAPGTTAGATNTKWNGYSVDVAGNKTPKNNQNLISRYTVQYTEIINPSLSWYIYFDGLSDATKTHSKLLKNWLVDCNVTTAQALAAQDNTQFKDLVNLYLWIKAVDEVGNVSETSHLLCVDPQGDRPSVSIEYPEKGDSIGGTIRLSGSVEDNTGVDSVWVQVISGVHPKDETTTSWGSFVQSSNEITSFTLNANDLNYMKSKTNTSVGLIEKKDTLTEWNGSAASGKTVNDYAIKANLSGSSWNLKINTNGEYNPASGTNGIAIRVYAVDLDGNRSYAATKYFKVDTSSPIVSDVMLKQYDESATDAQVLAGTATAVSEQEYVAGTFLKGKWYLTFTAKDDQEIGKVIYRDGETLQETDITNTYCSLSTTAKANDTVTVAYPLPTDTANSAGALDFDILVEDKNTPVNTSKIEIELGYDNVPPKLRRAGTEYSISPSVKQSNGFYTISSQVDESVEGATPSGLKAVAFYFVRRNKITSKVSVFDPMQIRTGAVEVTSAKQLTSSNTDGVVYDSGLYWLKRTISRDDNNPTTFTYTSITASAADEQSIHAGGLVQIRGVLYTILSVDGTKVIVDKNIPDVDSACFALGMVVDTAVENVRDETKDTDGYYKTFAVGDADRMYESIGGTKAQPTWEAQIVSKNIPDGPIEIHYVAFDNSGNYSIGIVGNTDWNTFKAASSLYNTADVNAVKGITPETAKNFATFVYDYEEERPAYVSNNPPRLASVTIGCDYDGNGKIGNQTNEKKTYFCKKVSGKDVAGGVTENLVVDSDDAAFMKLTDASSIEMEIIGGNGALYYSYNIDGASSNKISGANITSFATGNNDGEESDYLKNGEVTYKDEDVKNAHIKTIDLSLSQFDNYLGKGSGTGKANTAYIANNTTAKPLTTFEYTIWDSTDGEKVAGTNALATWSTQKAKMTVKLDVQVHDETAPNMVIDDFTTSHFEAATGHIDLSSNLPATPFNGTNGQFDKDPKVSGKIKVTGYAYDNIRLESLWLKADGFTFTPTTALTGGKNRATSDGYVQVAKFASGTWAGTENETAGWKFSVSKDEADGAYQNDFGHKVMWTLELDTTKVNGIAVADRTISVYAKDVRGTSATTTTGLYSSNSNNTTAGDTTFNKPNYRVDIVPYITGLARGTGLETKRSKLGKYQVVIGESVAVTGFNLPTGDAYYRVTTANMKSTTVPNTNKITSASRTVTGATLTVPGNSGYVVAVTNNIVSLNNMNTGNVQTGVNSDDAWTDDVYLSAWKNDEYFYFSNDPISPAMDRVPYTSNSSTINRLYGGWATNGSNFYASYPNTTGDGSKGNAPSPASGNSATSTSSSNFGDPATFYDVVTDANGNRYNVLLDCWQGSTNGWGKNFVINYNGYYYHNSCTTDNPDSDSTANNENLRHVIERMGNGGTAPDNANSSDGLDEMFNQFLNPRITMYNGEAYITYYDRYAKCLKWAMSAPIDNRSNLPKKYATEGIWLDNKYQKNAKDSNGKSAYYKNGGFVVAGYDTLQNSGSKTNLDVGLWSAIAIDTAASGTTAAPVIAYYDATNKKLMLATASSSGSGPSVAYPINSNSPVLTGTNVSGTEGNAWTRTEVKDSAKLKLGQYVSMVVDSSNNLHIAAYGTAGGNKLYYVKGTKSAYGTYTFETTCVDPNGAGTWTDIQLDSDENPVISYYDPSNDSSEHAVKVAYFDGTNWDTMTTPLASSAISNRITLALDITDGATITAAGKTKLTDNNCKLAVGYVSSRFDCIYLRKE